ncbi:uncharacterized protein LOC134864391 [Eleginops maclovinus]|uniref:uncharacterized protein LOC134864391 n=1 Tax=Eleginops maclovinus TaxID=56733 RepID=UPI00307FFA1A
MAAKNLPSEDRFLCSICLDVFTDPVTIPCGHNFCKNCITEHWDRSDRCQCPMCKEAFTTRPDLRVNTFISEMVAEFRQSAPQKASSSSSEQQVFQPEEVLCDVCTETKLKALKSCLVCLTSYCETHLEPHLIMSGLKRHQLIDPVENLEDRMCPKHDKPLELFCKTDQTCVCMLCTVLDHKMHKLVPLKEESEDKKAQLGKTEAEIQQMIQKRQLKIQEIKQSVDLSKEDADREVAEGVQVFTALKESVERGQANLINTIKEKQKTTEKQAEALIKELVLEISQLKKRSSVVELLSRSEDHLHFLQSVKTLNIQLPSPTKDWRNVNIRQSSYEGTVEKAVAHLETTLREQRKPLKAKMKVVQQYAVDVTLDPETAHPNLILSDDGKQVSLCKMTKILPYNPKRFHYSVCVLGKQSFSSGKYYFEVEVKGKTEWELGVARDSINRMGKIQLSPQRGTWIAWLRNGKEYKVFDDPPVLLSLKSQPQKVGVFVDYEEGLVSFYDVAAAALIYSFTGCSFTEKLYPYFNPCVNGGGQNSAPLIISPVRVSTNMAASNYLQSEDQFLCSICLDVFTDPVTTSCGHNFCKNCITKHWNSNYQYLCPMCKKVFNARPELHVNTFISEMVAQFRESAQQKASSSSSEQQVFKPGEVPCDVCTETKLKALKSCLVCLTSYCETHLEPHLTAPSLKRHQLIDPVENLEDRMCPKHSKPLELFCKIDQTCVCMLCAVSDHKMHDVVPLKEGYEGAKATLEVQIQQMIGKRQLKIHEIKDSVVLSEKDADREVAEGVQVFTVLMESTERGLNKLIDTVKEKQKTTEKQAESFIKDLEQEISELKKRSSLMERLSHSEDHLHLLQSFPSLKVAPQNKDWTKDSIRPSSHEGTVRRAVVQLEETLSKTLRTLFKTELKRVQKYAVDVTLDPDSAHPELILSDDGKQVKHCAVMKNLPDNPERFSYCNCVLGKQSFSSGRFYFEVEVKGKTEWDLGVARESINRKGYIRLSPEDGFWVIWLTNANEYEALDGPPVLLSLKSQPQKVGVFVDYEEGLVSFYDVDAAALIYSFTGCSFNGKIYPYFSPDCNSDGKNSAPLVISTVMVPKGPELIPLAMERGAGNTFDMLPVNYRADEGRMVRGTGGKLKLPLKKGNSTKSKLLLASPMPNPSFCEVKLPPASACRPKIRFNID